MKTPIYRHKTFQIPCPISICDTIVRRSTSLPGKKDPGKRTVWVLETSLGSFEQGISGFQLSRALSKRRIIASGWTHLLGFMESSTHKERIGYRKAKAGLSMEQDTNYLCLRVLLEEGSGGKVCL